MLGRRGSARAATAVLTVALVLLGALSGCGSSGPGAGAGHSKTPATTPPLTLPGDGPVTSSTATASPPASTSASTHPSASGPVKEVERTCPYIATQTLADMVGSRVGRTTVLTSSPVGCRFYLPFGDYHAVAQIRVAVYADETTAHNEMITSTAKSPERDGVPELTAGVEAILFRTTFYRPDGNRDWACTFRKGRTVVTVFTDRTDTSYNARQIAIAISGAF